MRSLHITFHGEKSWVQGEGAVRRRVYTHQRTLVSLLVNPRLCCTEERTRGHHEFMNESQLRECLVHGKRRLRRDLGATSQTGRQAPAGSAPAALGRAPAPAEGSGALPFSPLSQPPHILASQPKSCFLLQGTFAGAPNHRPPLCLHNSCVIFFVQFNKPELSITA